MSAPHLTPHPGQHSTPHAHVPYVGLVVLSLLVGLSISGGPVVWALLVMFSPLAALWWIARAGHSSAHRSTHR